MPLRKEETNIKQDHVQKQGKVHVEHVVGGLNIRSRRSAASPTRRHALSWDDETVQLKGLQPFAQKSRTSTVAK